MSLNIAMQNSLSALQSYAQSLDVTAQNISNVNTEGYTRKIAQMQAVTISGKGAGVEIAKISRNVNDLMTRDLRETLSQLGQSAARDLAPVSDVDAS